MQIFWQRFVFCWCWMLVKEWNYLISFDTNKKLYNYKHNAMIHVRLPETVHVQLVINTINNANRTEWSPIRSVIIWVMNKIGRPRSGSPICLITSMTADQFDETKFFYQLIITITKFLLF